MTTVRGGLLDTRLLDLDRREGGLPTAGRALVGDDMMGNRNKKGSSKGHTTSERATVAEHTSNDREGDWGFCLSPRDAHLKINTAVAVLTEY